MSYREIRFWSYRPPLIQDGDKSAYRQEVKELAVRCSLNNLEINTLKTGDDRGLQEKPPALPPLTIMNSTVTAAESFRFLAPQFLRTWSGTITLSPLWKRPSRGCTSLPDTETVSSPKQSISLILDNKHGTHNTIIHYSSHILIFHFKICTYQTCTYIIVYIIYCCFCYFVHCLFVYNFLLLSVSHNFGFGTIPECNTLVLILNHYHRWQITSLKKN